MKLEAKETRMIILGLKLLLEKTVNHMEAFSDDDDEYVHLSNDAMLIDTMIKTFEENYKNEYNHDDD